jgi:hypothetical protein
MRVYGQLDPGFGQQGIAFWSIRLIQSLNAITFKLMERLSPLEPTMIPTEQYPAGSL